ncbi:DUF6665 family protein [Kumtagia ephedrae]|uniref:Uncharacterized protein n=1 Tax=Kumtagia ephedrae TaxID=2116701 RepID=A0A2P7SDL7_9HYPH|nr:DUF6665 family protein [Mesorhizobium ephedrae]PSJ60606.1 hypothetical protein C7I84_11580 [Mesorhizobium ephedrae]
MALKLPGSTDLAARGHTGLEVLDYEIVAEMATSLGTAGRKVEAVMARLRAHQGEADQRRALLSEAAEAVYGYFVQRELCGLRRHDDVIRDYGIPREVLARLGAK